MPPTRKAYGLALVWTGDAAIAASLLAPVPGMASELATWSRFREERGERPLALSAARTSLAIAPDQPEVAGWLAAWKQALRRRASAGALTPNPASRSADSGLLVELEHRGDVLLDRELTLDPGATVLAHSPPARRIQQQRRDVAG